MGAWTEVVAVKVVRSNWILDIFSRQNGQDLLLDWIREVNERVKEDCNNVGLGDWKMELLID